MKPFNFIHIPKCGGTTLIYILQTQCNLKHIDKEERVHNYKDYDVLLGHYSYKVYNHLPMVTWVRNPIDRAISQYFQFLRRGKIVTYPDFRTMNTKEERDKTTIFEYVERIPNIMLAYLGENPNIFEYIGHLEEYDKHVRILGKKFDFNVPETYKKGRIGGNKHMDIITPEIIEKIKQVNKLDLELYEEIKNVWKI